MDRLRNKRKTAAKKSKTLKKSTMVAANVVYHHKGFNCGTIMQPKEVACTDQFNHLLCYNCIITSVSNDNAASAACSSSNKVCRSCGKVGHSLSTSK